MPALIGPRARTLSGKDCLRGEGDFGPGRAPRGLIPSAAMNSAKRLVGLLACFGALFGLAGCGGKSKLQPLAPGPMVPVQGKVTLAGKPLKGGNVFFYPQGEAKG